VPNYSIKNVRKSAVEFCLGIDSFEQENKIAILKKQKNEAENDWDKIRAGAEGLADLYALKIDRIPDLNADLEDSFSITDCP